MAPAYTEVFLNPVRLAARLVRRARLILLLLAPALCMAAAPSLDPGVSLTLAQWRAERYRDIHYAIDFDLQPGATRLEGLLEIRVSVASADDDLVLDWRSPLPEERIRDIHVNGLPAFGVRFVADHLVIPGALLTKGENREIGRAHV